MVLSLLPPTVRVLAPRVTVPPVVPAPERDPTVKEVARFSVAPAVLAMLTALEVLPSAVAFAVVRVPLEMTIGPVKVLAPLNVVAVPLVLLTKMPPVPETMPE